MNNIVVFTAKWCSNCPPVKNLLTMKGVDFSSVDTDTQEGEELVAANHVRSLPTVLVFDDAGRETHRLVSFKSVQEYLNNAD
tara:strand:+ start:117 stop:362 length:246 start_codon:yes stop_codon:yes gene_type:complete